MHILIPSADADRRQAAHLVEDNSEQSLCGLHMWQTGEERIPDVPENRRRVYQQHQHICGLCLDILRRRANAAETACREAERKAQPRPPTKRQIEAEKWLAFTGKPPPNWRLKHDEDHIVNTGAVIE